MPESATLAMSTPGNASSVMLAAGDQSGTGSISSFVIPRPIASRQNSKRSGSGTSLVEKRIGANAVAEAIGTLFLLPAYAKIQPFVQNVTVFA
jgi:hypothetical protein